MSIYIKDSVVGSFKYSANVSEILVIENTVQYDIQFIQVIGNNNFNIEFRLTNLKTIRGTVQKYVLSKRVLLQGDTSWSAWEPILENNINLLPATIYSENLSQVISNPSFIVQPDNYQFKLEFYNIIGEIGALDDTDNLSIVIQDVEATSYTLEVSAVTALKVGNNINIPAIGAEINLPVLEAKGTMIRLSTLSIDMPQPITIPDDVGTLLHNYSGATLNTDASIMCYNNIYTPWYTPVNVVTLDNIYAASTANYGGAYEPEVNIPIPTYEQVSHVLDSDAFSIDVNFPLGLLKASNSTYVDNTDLITFKNILGADKSITWGYYLQNYYGSYFYIKVYYFIPTDINDQDAPVDPYPTSVSTLGKWYYKEQFKLVDLLQNASSAFEVTNADGKYFMQPIRIPLRYLPKGKVFYIWVGFGYEFPNAVKAMPTIAQIETKKVWL